MYDKNKDTPLVCVVMFATFYPFLQCSKFSLMRITFRF